MREWMIQYGSYGLAPFGLLGMWVTGQKKTWGWLLGMGTQTLWGAYAVTTGQYGFMAGTTAYFLVYLKNWTSWRRAATAPVPAAVPGMEEA